MARLRGFTFIELLIAVSIFAVVAIALYSTFFAGIAVWKRSSTGGSVYHDVKFAFDDIARDLKSAVYLSDEEESIFTFSGSGIEITFITLEPIFLKDHTGQELVKVSYRFDDETGQLIRVKADMAIGFDIEKAEQEVLLENLKGFTLEYCYDSKDEDEPYIWEEEWEDEEMRIPRGVKVTSLIESGSEGIEALKFSEIIFVPTGILGVEEVGL